MVKKKLINKSLEEIKADLESEVIDAYDCMATALEEFDKVIQYGCSTGYTPVRDAQSKIRELFDYLSSQQNPFKLPEKQEEYFRIMYNGILERYNLILDDKGIVRGAKVGRFNRKYSSVYLKEVIKDPFKSVRTWKK